MRQRLLCMAGIALTAGIMLSTCANEDTSNNRYGAKLGLIDISNARALMVIPSDSFSRASSRASGDTVFVKQLANGDIVEVAVQDVNGNTVSAVPSKIIDTAQDYMIITMNYDDRYLVNKTNGAAYDLSPAGDMDFKTGPISDSNGNIYGTQRYYDEDTRINWSAVHKINVENPAQITLEQITPSLYNVLEFSVDSQGNVLYNGSLGGSWSFRLRKANGETEEFGFALSFTGYDGAIYCLMGGGVLNKLSITGGTVEFIPTSLTLDLDFYPENIYYLEDKIIVMRLEEYNRYEEGSGTQITITILYDEHGEPRQLEPIELVSSWVSARFISAGSSNVYIVTEDNNYGNEALLKVALDTGEITTLIEPGTYETIYKMAATKDDVVIVNALSEENFTVKKILANIAADGTVTVREDIVGTEIILLERVN